MAGGSYSNLPAPKKPYRLGKDTRHVDGVVRFRDRESELRQDKKHCTRSRAERCNPYLEPTEANL